MTHNSLSEGKKKLRSGTSHLERLVEGVIGRNFNTCCSSDPSSFATSGDREEFDLLRGRGQLQVVS